MHKTIKRISNLKSRAKHTLKKLKNKLRLKKHKNNLLPNEHNPMHKLNNSPANNLLVNTSEFNRSVLKAPNWLYLGNVKHIYKTANNSTKNKSVKNKSAKKSGNGFKRHANNFNNPIRQSSPNFFNPKP